MYIRHVLTFKQHHTIPSCSRLRLFQSIYIACYKTDCFNIKSLLCTTMMISSLYGVETLLLKQSVYHIMFCLPLYGLHIYVFQLFLPAQDYPGAVLLSVKGRGDFLLCLSRPWRVLNSTLGGCFIDVRPEDWTIIKCIYTRKQAYTHVHTRTHIDIQTNTHTKCSHTIYLLIYLYSRE